MRIGRAERGPAMRSWKPIEDAPKDGRSVLLWARLKTPPEERDDIGYPIVGFWLRNIGWKVAPELLNRDEELIPTYWTEIPEPPEL
jgi:hypothetical protein